MPSEGIIISLIGITPSLLVVLMIYRQGKVLKDVHKLTNSDMGVQKRTLALVLRRIAKDTKDPDDIKAADLAEDEWHKHDENQARVDNCN